MIRPGEAELADPRVFGDRVRGVVSMSLGLPTSDDSLKQARSCQAEARRRRRGSVATEVTVVEDNVMEDNVLEDPVMEDTGGLRSHSRTASSVSINLVGEHTFGI